MPEISEEDQQQKPPSGAEAGTAPSPADLFRQVAADVIDRTVNLPHEGQQERAAAAAQLFQEVRQQALGENPTPDAVEAFNNSTQGLALNVLERYYNLYGAGRPPFLVAGTARDFLLNSGRVGLDVVGQFVIDLESKDRSGLEAGCISLKAPMSGGDDSLLPGSFSVYEVDINVKTGEMTGSGGAQVTPSVKGRLDSILRTTQAYYATVERSIPLARSFQQAAGFVPHGLISSFPFDAISQVRES